MYNDYQRRISESNNKISSHNESATSIGNNMNNQSFQQLPNKDNNKYT